jgi:hypothetical protein
MPKFTLPNLPKSTLPNVKNLPSPLGRGKPICIKAGCQEISAVAAGVFLARYWQVPPPSRTLPSLPRRAGAQTPDTFLPGFHLFSDYVVSPTPSLKGVIFYETWVNILI